MTLTRNMLSIISTVQRPVSQRYLHVSAALSKVQSAVYRPTPKQDKPLTYEMANPPQYIGVRKSWNSFNTSNLKDAPRPSETAIEDLFIRRFVTGTWHALFLSEIIIKRQHNIVRISGIISRQLKPVKLYFLIGYTEQFLSYWLQCPVKLELVSTAERADVIYKYI